MKTLLVCIFLTFTCCLAALTDEQKAKIDPISKECREKTGATLEQTTKLRDSKVIPDDAKVQKHVVCVLKKTGIMTDTDEISKEKVEAIMTRIGLDDDTKVKLRVCIAKKDTPEDTAVSFLRCTWEVKDNFSPAD